MAAQTSTEDFTLLDGGMGRQLLQMGAPFRQPEWSALALMETPHLVQQVHEQFALAGSDILTTNSYAVVPYHLGKKRFYDGGASLAALSGKLADNVAKKFGKQVAGSLPPLFGSYRPDLFIHDKALDILRILIDALDPYVDIWLAETLSSIDEAKVVLDALSEDRRPVWISYTLQDEDTSPTDIARLRSGESVTEAVRFTTQQRAAAILFNCSQPEVMSSAIEATQNELKRLGLKLPVGIYANAFPAQKKDAQANEAIQDIRQNLDPTGYATFAQQWYLQGATIIGGCCGIGPEHIKAMHTVLKKKKSVAR